MNYGNGFVLPATNCVTACLDEVRKCLLVHHLGAISVNTTISCEMNSEQLNAIFRSYVSYITGETCTQETFHVNVDYNTVLGPYKVEAFINDVNQDHIGRYSIRGVFRRVEEDV